MVCSVWVLYKTPPSPPRCLFNWRKSALSVTWLTPLPPCVLYLCLNESLANHPWVMFCNCPRLNIQILCVFLCWSQFVPRDIELSGFVCTWKKMRKSPHLWFNYTFHVTFGKWLWWQRKVFKFDFAFFLSYSLRCSREGATSNRRWSAGSILKQRLIVIACSRWQVQ